MKLYDSIYYIIIISFSYRLFIGHIITTTYLPDEYFQTIEPAFRLIYNNNDITNELWLSKLTWEWNHQYQIRSYILLIPYIIYFYIGKYFNIDTTNYVKFGPRLFQSVLASISDVILFLIINKIYNHDNKINNNIIVKSNKYKVNNNLYPYVIFIIHLLSWSYTYCISRTLANSIETVFQIIGLWFWLPYLLNNNNNNNKYIINITNLPLLAIFITTISVYARPTAILWWFPIGLTWLYLLKINTTNLNFIYIIIKCIIIGIILILLFIGVDSYFYYIATNIEVIKIDFNKIINMDIISIFNYFKTYIVFTPINFFNINIILNYASLFGVKKWYWTLIEGFPVMLGLYLPFTIYGIYSNFIYQTHSNIPQFMKYLILLSFFYSFSLRVVSAHQEYRFLLPCLPFIHGLIGHVITNLITDNNNGNNSDKLNLEKSNYKIWRIVICFICLIHFFSSVFLLTKHQFG